eukprot:1506327-Pleurochrysis_carterae.AAC.1
MLLAAIKTTLAKEEGLIAKSTARRDGTRPSTTRPDLGPALAPLGEHGCERKAREWRFTRSLANLHRTVETPSRLVSGAYALACWSSFHATHHRVLHRMYTLCSESSPARGVHCAQPGCTRGYEE